MEFRFGVAFASAAEMEAIDRAEMNAGVAQDQLMERAGEAVAKVVELVPEVNGRVVVVAGKGNNGGDGLVAARLLIEKGMRVDVVLAVSGEDLGEVPRAQLKRLQETGTAPSDRSCITNAGLIVDALLGYGAKGGPREPVATLIRDANSTGVRTVAVDVPSGLDPTTGEVNEPCIRATVTAALGLPKSGFLSARAKEFVGELYVADIGIGEEVYKLGGASKPDFGMNGLLKVW